MVWYSSTPNCTVLTAFSHSIACISTLLILGFLCSSVLALFASAASPFSTCSRVIGEYRGLKGTLTFAWTSGVTGTSSPTRCTGSPPTLLELATSVVGPWWNCSAWWKRHNWLWHMYNLGCLCLLKDSAISKLHITLDLSRFVMSCHPLLFSFLIFLFLSLCLHCFCILIHQRARLKRAYWRCKTHRSRVDFLLGRLDSSSKTNFVLPWKEVKLFVIRYVRRSVCLILLTDFVRISPLPVYRRKLCCPSPFPTNNMRCHFGLPL